MWPEYMAIVLLADVQGKHLFWQGTASTLPRAFVEAIDGCEINLAGPCPSAAYRGEPIIIADIARDVETREFVDLCAQHGLCSVWSTPVFSKRKRVLGTLAVYSRRPGTPTEEQCNQMGQLTNLASIAIERAQSEAALRRSEMYLQNAQRLSRTGSFGWMVPSNLITWSDETYRIFGIERDVEIDLDVVMTRVHPDDRARFREVAERARAEQQGFEFQHRLVMTDGDIKHVHVVAHAVHDERRGLVEFIGSVNDITAQKREEARLQAALAEREALLKEVHHRVKNNLQLISSLLNLQASRATDPAVVELFADSRNRVRSMALVHENLYRAGSFAKVAMASHIETLCAHLARAYGSASRSIQLTIDVSDLRLGLDAAVSCGLIINELVSNAFKHAFARENPGNVHVTLREASEGRHVLTVADDGIGLPAGLEVGTGSSLGMLLVRDLTAQLHGTLCVERGRGTTFRIDFAEHARTERRS